MALCRGMKATLCFAPAASAPGSFWVARHSFTGVLVGHAPVRRYSFGTSFLILGNRLYSTLNHLETAWSAAISRCFRQPTRRHGARLRAANPVAHHLNIAAVAFPMPQSGRAGTPVHPPQSCPGGRAHFLRKAGARVEPRPPTLRSSELRL